MKSNSRIAIFLIVCLSLLLCQDDIIIIKEAVVNGSVILPSPCSANEMVEWSIFDPTKTSIAKCESRTCKISTDFENTFVIVDPNSGNFSLSISKAAYNDDGTYECSCNGKLHYVKLRVFGPQIVTATEKDSVTLTCLIRVKDVKNVIWKTNGKTVAQYSSENKSLVVDKDLEGRVTLDEGGFSRGNYSLHMSSVCQADMGLYRCLFKDEYEEGYPHAVQLIVNGKHPHASRDNCSIGIYIGFYIGFGVSVFMNIVFLLLTCVSRCKRPQPKTSSKVGSPVQEEFPLNTEAALKSSTVPIQDE